MRRFFLSLTLLAASLLCAAQPPAAGTLEPIHALSLAKGTLSVGVHTTGYTDASSFLVEVQRPAGERTISLRILRVKRDEGKMMPQPITVRFSLAELKIDTRSLLKVENPFCHEAE